jgi:hypothetical protein
MGKPEILHGAQIQEYPVDKMKLSAQKYATRSSKSFRKHTLKPPFERYSEGYTK